MKPHTNTAQPCCVHPSQPACLPSTCCAALSPIPVGATRIHIPQKPTFRWRGGAVQGVVDPGIWVQSSQQAHHINTHPVPNSAETGITYQRSNPTLVSSYCAAQGHITHGNEQHMLGRLQGPRSLCCWTCCPGGTALACPCCRKGQNTPSPYAHASFGLRRM